MKRDDLLKMIAEKGYDVGFGAKRNFSTFDIVTRAPIYISFVSIAIGIIELAGPILGGKAISIILLIAGLMSLVISLFDEDIKKYDKEGIRETILWDRYKNLYQEVKDLDVNIDINEYSRKLESLNAEFYSQTITKQMWLSNWFAHYKFFNEMNIDWLDEQLHFKFWKDKIPGTAKWTIYITVLILIIVLIYIFRAVLCSLVC